MNTYPAVKNELRGTDDAAISFWMPECVTRDSKRTCGKVLGTHMSFLHHCDKMGFGS